MWVRTINLSPLTGWQQAILFILMNLGNPVRHSQGEISLLRVDRLTHVHKYR